MFAQPHNRGPPRWPTPFAATPRPGISYPSPGTQTDNPSPEANDMMNGSIDMSVTRRGQACSSTVNTLVPPRGAHGARIRIPLGLLRLALRHTRLDASPGVDGVMGVDYLATADSRLPQLQRDLQAGVWQPGPVRRRRIYKGTDPAGNPEYRPLGLPRHEDKIVQLSILMQHEAGAEAIFIANSYGFRPRTGTIQACTRIRDLLVGWEGAWVLALTSRSSSTASATQT